MLPERMYQSLREGRLPRVYLTRGIVRRTQGIAQTLRIRRGNVRNLTTKLVRPLAARKAVAITDSAFSGYKITLKGAYIGKYGDELSYKVGYESQFVRPTMAKMVQSIGDVEETTHVLFMPQASFDKTVKKSITRPEALTCVASVTSEKGFFKYDALSEQFNVGVLDDRFKPATEYPVPGADNAILDLSYSWRVENKIYPQPLPSGLSFYSLVTDPFQGFFSYGGKYYAEPAVDKLVNVRSVIRNRTGSTLRVEQWGLLLSVLYDDNRRVSQVNIDIGFPTVNIGNGRDWVMSPSFPLPNWCYGKIAVAHAMNFYKDGMFIYGGGPLWQFEVFRLLLP